nr:hypothetical protein [uncultured Duganella sp.]
MVQFEEDVRAALFGAGVLVLDENGKTVFTGLTASETKFVLEFEESDLWCNRDKSHHFQKLLAKFHTAREISMRNTEALTNERLSRFRSRPSSL